MNLRIIFVIFFLLFGLCRLSGDSPLAPPSKHSVKSPDGNITAVSDPESRTTIVQRTTTNEQLWQIPSWERWLFVANDGKHAVTGYGGINLIPVEYDEEMVLFTFWREGRKIRDVTLKEFVPRKRILRRTVSHYYWGIIEKIDAEGYLVIRRADDKVFLYDLNTGKLAK